ncbi:hypothetical protein ACJIZ3_011492 [Penstemon smallii]|uniref:KIB1-4 beta-propeller domain-containing protein n=1 Tax=Penstemon smallii TaxID=265156 RepID=A0ABD3UMV1_9LAMI
MAGEGRKRMRLTQSLPQQIESELPPEILENIISRLELEDNTRALASLWLMVFLTAMLYKFYDLSQSRTYWLELPGLDEAKVCHSKDGWLLLSKPRLRKIFFFCPYTQKLINLPNIEFSYERVKIAFSTCPKSTSCVVLYVRFVRPYIVALSNSRPGATEWSTVFYPNPMEFHKSLCSNLVFGNNRFYYFCVTAWVRVYRLDFNTWSHDGKMILILTSFVINRVVYQLDQVNLVWAEMKSIGGMSLFASFLFSYARVDLLGKLRSSVYFLKCLFPKGSVSWKTLVSYSVTEGRYYPQNQIYIWGEDDP